MNIAGNISIITGGTERMPKYAIAFISPAETNELRHSIIESPDKDTALRQFFAQEVSELYSSDEQGYYYFREDFYDELVRSGSIIECS
jgi:guanylate kinase